jgi:hypothetical protein
LDRELEAVAADELGNTLFSRLSPDVDVMWRLGKVDLSILLSERVRRPRGLVPTGTLPWCAASLREALGYQQLGWGWDRERYYHKGAVEDRPGGRLILVDAIAPTAVFERNFWRLGRISSVASVHRVCAACSMMEVPAVLDIGSFCWFKRGDPEDEIGLRIGASVRIWWKQ